MTTHALIYSSGAIRRSREEADEKAKPLMSYESFVESLDEDDTFTTTLFEILLKVRVALCMPAT